MVLLGTSPCSDRLLAHVVDVDLGHLAEGGRVGEHRRGIVHVHVDLEQLGVADDELAAALLRHPRLDRVAVEVLAVDQELSAVEVVRVVPVVGASLDVGLRLDGRVHGLELASLERGDEPFGEDRQPERPRVDHSGVLEHRQQLGRATHRGVDLGDRHLHDVVCRRSLAGRAARGASRVLHDGEHRALDGLTHRLVGRALGAGQSVGDDLSGHLLGAVGGFAQPSQHLGQDHPRVAARSHERPVRDGLADVGDRGVGGQQGEFADDRVHGERHVRAGVPVGHREDVEAVHLLTTRLERDGGVRDQPGCGRPHVLGLGRFGHKDLRLLLVDLDALDVDLDLAHPHGAILLEHVADAVGQVASDLGERRPMLQDHEEVDPLDAVLPAHADTLPEPVAGQKLGHAVTNGRARHAHDTERLERGIAGQIGYHVVGYADDPVHGTFAHLDPLVLGGRQSVESVEQALDRDVVHGRDRLEGLHLRGQARRASEPETVEDRDGLGMRHEHIRDEHVR
jgi:hypothetical protein